MKKLLLLLITLSLSGYQLPRQKNYFHRGISSGDLTESLVTNVAFGINTFYWNNEEGTVFNETFKTLSFGVVMDYYWIFYEGLTWSLFFETTPSNSDEITFNRGYGTFGYRLFLYHFFTMKGEGLIAVGRDRWIDIGGSFSIGMEFSLFDYVTIGLYQNIQMMLFNFDNVTNITTETRFVIGGYL